MSREARALSSRRRLWVSVPRRPTPAGVPCLPLASRNLPGLALEADVPTGVAVDVDLGGRLPGVAAVGVPVEPQPAEVVLQGAGRLLVGQLDPALVRVVSRPGPAELLALDVVGNPDAPVQWAVGRPVTLLHEVLQDACLMRERLG